MMMTLAVHFQTKKRAVDGMRMQAQGITPRHAEEEVADVSKLKHRYFNGLGAEGLGKGL